MCFVSCVYRYIFFTDIMLLIFLLNHALMHQYSYIYLSSFLACSSLIGLLRFAESMEVNYTFTISCFTDAWGHIPDPHK